MTSSIPKTLFLVKLPQIIFGQWNVMIVCYYFIQHSAYFRNSYCPVAANTPASRLGGARAEYVGNFDRRTQTLEIILLQRFQFPPSPILACMDVQDLGTHEQKTLPSVSRLQTQYLMYFSIWSGKHISC